MSITFLPNQPIVFGYEEKDCHVFDERQYCQKIQRGTETTQLQYLSTETPDQTVFLIYDLDGNFVRDITPDMTKTQSGEYVTAIIPLNLLADGCYKICTGILSANLILNGTFSTDTVWTKGAEWSIGSGKATYNGFSDDAIYQNINLIEGKRYLVKYSIVNAATFNCRIRVDIGSGVLIGFTGQWHQAVGTYTEYFISNYTGSFRFDFLVDNQHAGDAATISIDNVSMGIYECDVSSECVSIADEWPCTKLMRWIGSQDGPAYALGFDWEDGLSFSLRLDMLLRKANYEEEVEDFIDSRGHRSIFIGSSSKTYEVFIDEVPEYIHDAIRIAKLSDYFLIDNVEYRPLKGKYTPEWKDELKWAQSRFEVYLQDENIKNTNC